MKLSDRLPWLCLVLGGVLLLSDGATPFGPTDGPRHVVILRESLNRTPAMKAMEINLRDGENATYLKDKGHVLDIWDDDAVGSDGVPVPLAVQLNALGLPAPSLFVLAPQGDAVLHKQTLPKDATAAQVIEAVKGTGG